MNISQFIAILANVFDTSREFAVHPYSLSFCTVSVTVLEVLKKPEVCKIFSFGFISYGANNFGLSNSGSKTSALSNDSKPSYVLDSGSGTSCSAAVF